MRAGHHSHLAAYNTPSKPTTPDWPLCQAGTVLSVLWIISCDPHHSSRSDLWLAKFHFTREKVKAYRYEITCVQSQSFCAIQQLFKLRSNSHTLARDHCTPLPPSCIHTVGKAGLLSPHLQKWGTLDIKVMKENYSPLLTFSRLETLKQTLHRWVNSCKFSWFCIINVNMFWVSPENVYQN